MTSLNELWLQTNQLTSLTLPPDLHNLYALHLDQQSAHDPRFS